ARRQGREVEQYHGKVQALAGMKGRKPDGLLLLEGKILVPNIGELVAGMAEHVPDGDQVRARGGQHGEVLRVIAEGVDEERGLAEQEPRELVTGCRRVELRDRTFTEC